MEDLRVVYESTNRQNCSDRALVLASVQIPYQLLDDGMSCVLVVPAEHSPRAVEELRLYDDENPPARCRERGAEVDHGRCVEGAVSRQEFHLHQSA